MLEISTSEWSCIVTTLKIHSKSARQEHSQECISLNDYPGDGSTLTS